MRRTIITLSMASVIALSAIGVAAIKDTDTARLERAKAARDTEISKAAERYLKAIEDANEKAKITYTSLIQQYTRTGDKDTAAQLQAELEQLLAPANIPDPTDVAPKNYNRDLVRAIGPALVRADGGRVDTEQLGDIPHVLLYFSASWCGPCKKFTPDLVDFFNEVSASKKVMVVLVGSDHSEMDQMNYMKEHKMPWVAVPFARIQPSGIVKKYGGAGIPNLVLLKTDGTVESGSYVKGEYVGPSKVLFDLKQILAAEAKAEKTGT